MVTSLTANQGWSDSRVPTLTIRPSATATAVASGRAGSMVMIFLAVYTTSSVAPATVAWVASSASKPRIRRCFMRVSLWLGDNRVT